MSERLTEVFGGTTGPPVFSRLFTRGILNRFNEISSIFGLGLNSHVYNKPGKLISGIVFKRAIPMAVALYGYNILDNLVDILPPFNGTIFAHGITAGVGNMLATGRLKLASFHEMSGIQHVASYMEGLFPGSINSTLMRSIRTIGPVFGLAAAGYKIGGGPGGFVGTVAGVLIAGAGGFGMVDITKKREEMEKIYAGEVEVPVKRGRWWELSAYTPYEGDGVKYWRKSWITRMRAKAKFTPTLYGSSLEYVLMNSPIVRALAPNYWARKQYGKRPYPITKPIGIDIPFIGPEIAAFAENFYPAEQMHTVEINMANVDVSDFKNLDYTAGVKLATNKYNTVMLGTGRGGSMNSGNSLMTPSFLPGPLYQIGANKSTTAAARSLFGEMWYRNIEEPLGLVGFTMTQAAGDMVNHVRTYADTSMMTSFRRAFWDEEIGGLMGLTEWFRRFYPNYTKQRAAGIYNPIPNLVPSWLPGSTYMKDFKSGDPYVKVEKGEERIPGWGHMTLNNVVLSFPVDIRNLTLDSSEMVRRMLTNESPMRRYIRRQFHRLEDMVGHQLADELRRQNLLVKAQVNLFDPYREISASVNAIIRDGKQQAALIVRTLDEGNLNDLAASKEDARFQLNYILGRMRMKKGYIYYINPMTAALEQLEPMYFDPITYEYQLGMIQWAREQAHGLVEAYRLPPGEGYSTFDRFKVLADIAPYSDEFRKYLFRVNQMKKAGVLTKAEIEMMDRILYQREKVLQRYELYPYRFKNPWNPSDEDPTRFNLNEHMKPASEYTIGERIIGSIWERFIMHNRIPIVSKFMPYRSPYENYLDRELWGKRVGMWNRPVDDFLKPSIRQLWGSKGFIRNVARGYMLGTTLTSNPVWGLILSAAGGAKSIFNKLRPHKLYIPKEEKLARKIFDQFDMMKFVKGRMLYNLTGNPQFQEMAEKTFYGAKNLGDIMSASYYKEKPYILPFVYETDPSERSKILTAVPDSLRRVLIREWASRDYGLINDRYNKELPENQLLPSPEWLGWSPEVELEDVEYKVLQQEGLNARDYGLGFNNQLNRIAQSPLIPSLADFDTPVDNLVSGQQYTPVSYTHLTLPTN